jgi:tetratricopeptide (TPR) repeat protein
MQGDKMKRKIAILAVLGLLLSPVMQAADTIVKPGSVSIWQARRTIKAAEYSSERYKMGHKGIDRKSIHFTPDTLEFDTSDSKAGRKYFQLDLKTVESMYAKCHGSSMFYCDLKDEKGKSIPDDSPLGLIWGQGPWSGLCNIPDAKCPDDRIRETTRTAQAFVDAISRLRAFANDSGTPLRNFTQQAAAWRALASKPQIPDQVREQRLMAEDAVKNKKPEEALGYYEVGLELYPTWPKGYFNAALITGELGFYEDAIEHMQAYLELAPNAPDAQAAQDQIVIWRHKAKQ